MIISAESHNSTLGKEDISQILTCVLRFVASNHIYHFETTPNFLKSIFVIREWPFPPWNVKWLVFHDLVNRDFFKNLSKQIFCDEKKTFKARFKRRILHAPNRIA